MTKREEGEESFFAGFQQRAAAKEKDPAGRRAFSSEEEEEEERRVSVSSTSPASGATKSSAESGRSVGERHRSVRPRRERGRGSGGQTDGMNARDEQKWRRSPRVRSPNNDNNNNNNNNEGHHDTTTTTTTTTSNSNNNVIVNLIKIGRREGKIRSVGSRRIPVRDRRKRRRRPDST